MQYLLVTNVLRATPDNHSITCWMCYSKNLHSQISKLEIVLRLFMYLTRQGNKTNQETNNKTIKIKHKSKVMRILRFRAMLFKAFESSNTFWTRLSFSGWTGRTRGSGWSRWSTRSFLHNLGIFDEENQIKTLKIIFLKVTIQRSQFHNLT